MFIVNQDRDQLIEFTGDLHSEPVFSNDLLIGFNLLTNGILLGTFNSMEEIISEIMQIVNCADDTYMINGYAPWDVWEDWKTIQGAMLEDEAI